MPFTVIIPARMASTRLLNKPLADLGGKPLVVRVAERAMQSGADQVIVATDHADIASICQKHHVTAHMTRSDHASGTDRIAEVAAAMGLSNEAIVVNVQGDEPLIDPTLIAATAAQINDDTPMATVAHAIDDIHEIFNPNVVKLVINQAGKALYFSRAPLPWHRDGFAQSKTTMPINHVALRHIGLYAYRNAFLQTYPKLALSPLEQIEALEQLRALWHGFPIAVHVTQIRPGIGIDTPEDLRRAQAYFSQQIP